MIVFLPSPKTDEQARLYVKAIVWGVIIGTILGIVLIAAINAWAADSLEDNIQTLQNVVQQMRRQRNDEDVIMAREIRLRDQEIARLRAEIEKLTKPTEEPKEKP